MSVIPLCSLKSCNNHINIWWLMLLGISSRREQIKMFATNGKGCAIICIRVESDKPDSEKWIWNWTCDFRKLTYTLWVFSCIKNNTSGFHYDTYIKLLLWGICRLTVRWWQLNKWNYMYILSSYFLNAWNLSLSALTFPPFPLSLHLLLSLYCMYVCQSLSLSVFCTISLSLHICVYNI